MTETELNQHYLIATRRLKSIKQDSLCRLRERNPNTHTPNKDMILSSHHMPKIQRKLSTPIMRPLSSPLNPATQGTHIIFSHHTLVIITHQPDCPKCSHHPLPVRAYPTFSMVLFVDRSHGCFGLSLTLFCLSRFPLVPEISSIVSHMKESTWPEGPRVGMAPATGAFLRSDRG